MRIIKLALENFQGIERLELEMNGESCSIFGTNETGKTTVFNAVTWLLFDKASTGEKGYTPKTHDARGNYMHNLDHAAVARFQTDGGRIVTVRKVYHELYKKKRGSVAEEFSGHGTDYYIDGVPTKEKDYVSTLTSLCGGAEQMKMLTMPDYFPEAMGWSDRRRLLLDICGDVSDSEVIASSDELAELPDILLIPGTDNQFYTVDEYKKIAASKKADINKQLAVIPARIDEAQKAMPDIQGLDKAAIDAEIARLQSEKAKLEADTKAAIGGSTASVDTEIAEATAALAQSKAAYVKATGKANEGLYAQIDELTAKRSKAATALQTARFEIDRLEMLAERMKSHRQSLVDEYTRAQAEQWDEGNELCPTCHRALPAEDVERMRDDFNLRKSKRLESINAKGQKEASKDMLDDLARKAAEQRDAASELEQEAAKYDGEIARTRARLAHVMPFEETQRYKLLAAEIDGLRNRRNDIVDQTGKATIEATARMNRLADSIDSLQTKRLQIETAARQRDRIAQLEAQEKQLSASFEELAKGIYLCEQFIRSKVSMLTERINSKFKHVRFRLFTEQNNGGIDEDCEVMIPSSRGRMVAFSSANNAGRINAGLEIIETLSRHWGISMPVFIDNAESVVHIAPIDGQIVRLVVSEADKALRLAFDFGAEEKSA